MEMLKHCLVFALFCSFTFNGTFQWILHGKLKLNSHLCGKQKAQLGVTAVDGGIKGALKEDIITERKASGGHVKCMNWHVKEEVSHTTNFES